MIIINFIFKNFNLNLSLELVFVYYNRILCGLGGVIKMLKWVLEKNIIKLL